MGRFWPPQKSQAHSSTHSISNMATDATPFKQDRDLGWRGSASWMMIWRLGGSNATAYSVTAQRHSCPKISNFRSNYSSSGWSSSCGGGIPTGKLDCAVLSSTLSKIGPLGGPILDKVE